jgi:hypothetical protein
MSDANPPVIFSAKRQADRDAIASATNRGAERITAWIFLNFVALCLVLPLIQTLYPIFGTIVPLLEERRADNPFPSLGLLLGTNGDFAVGLNKWFDDRVGFRALFIRTKNQIDYTLFHISKKVYVGSDGWLFPRGNAVAHLDAAGLLALEHSYLTLARRLHEKGVRLIVVGYPDKKAIYPEMMPSQMPAVPPGGNYDKFRYFLSTHDELTFIDAGEIIKREKQNSPAPMYYKTDMHATEAAQIPVVKEIVETIARAEGRPEIQWNEKFTVIHGNWSPGHGSEARFMSILFPPIEQLNGLAGTYTVGDREADGHWIVPDPVVFERAERRHWASLRF